MLETKITVGLQESERNLFKKGLLDASYAPHFLLLSNSKNSAQGK